MTQAEQDDLIDLYVDEALPAALRGFVETLLAARPALQAEARGLQQAAARLQAAPPEKPDDWFTERTLDRLLREHAAAQETERQIHTR